MTLDTVEILLEEELKDLYDAEKQLVKALPKMVKAVDSEDLQSSFEVHLEVTKQQVARLERVFELLGVDVKGKTCKAMRV